jgi:anti-sigma regulatory factor (Ser/Thr protein kinase)
MWMSGSPVHMPPDPLSRQFRAVPEHVGEARRAVADYARRHGASDAEAIALAVSEVVTNAVLHAYIERPEPGDIEVTALRHPCDGLEVRVCDDGRGMKPRPDSPGMGVGLPLAATLAEEFEVEARPGGGTRIRMVFAAE